ncbi:MAG: hypothetical protein FWD35_04185, partial [Oscillospiraceae bacterium]|nr:hypothetical protein [Oscillospiraceae bacterium]
MANKHELTPEQARIAAYNRGLMDKAVESGRKTKLPKWFYLARRIRGGLVWLSMFKIYGTSRALEPVYAHAFLTRDLIPDEVKGLFKTVSDDIVDFIQYTEFGEAGGARFAHHVNAVRNCPDDVDTIVSLGAGSSLAETVGLWHRRNDGLPLPKIHLVDWDMVGLARAKTFA